MYAHTFQRLTGQKLADHSNTVANVQLYKLRIHLHYCPFAFTDPIIINGPEALFAIVLHNYVGSL